MTLAALFLAAVAALPSGLQRYVRTYSPVANPDRATEYFQGRGLSIAEARTYAAAVKVESSAHRSCGFMSVNIDCPGKRAWASIFVRNQERSAGRWAPCGSAQFWDFPGNPNHHHNWCWDFFDANPRGAWHHVAIVVTARTVKYYFDGRPVSQYRLDTPATKADKFAEVAFNYDGHGVSAERLVIDAALPDAEVKEYADAVRSYLAYCDMRSRKE